MRMAWTHTLANGWDVVARYVLDPSIIFSFDQTGFERHRVQFDAHDLDVDMSGRNCVVTGANSGLGFATAMGLAERGASVWLLCRNKEKGAAAAQQIREKTTNERIFVSVVDLADFDSIDRFVREEAPEAVDVLVNNAGVLLSGLDVSKNGIELTLATNLVGPVRLTASLIPNLRAGQRSRIVWVSSGGMYAKRLNVDLLEQPCGPFDGVSVYAHTKRAMVIFSEMLADTLSESGIASHCMHPGWANTPGVEHSIPNFWRVTKQILRSSTEGADTILWLAVCDKAQQNAGKFWFDRQARKTHFLRYTKESAEVRATFWDRLHVWALIGPESWE